MMYKTHVKVSQTLYMLSIPVLSQLELMPNIVDVVSKGNPSEIAMTTLTLGASAVVGFHGATWGAGFPDIDHPTSIPAKKNPVISSIFKALKVKHRGRYSHSIDMITLTFMLIMLGLNFITKPITGFFEIVPNIAKVWLISAYIGAITHLFADSLTKQGIRVLFFLPQVKLVLTRLNTSILTVAILTMTGLVVNIFKINELKTTEIIFAIGTIALSFLVSSAIYTVVNKSKPLKYLLALLSIGALAATILMTLPLEGTLLNIARITLISVMIPSIMPGLDFFKTGDDSTWEQLVRKLFTILQPLSIIAVVGIYALQLIK